jgi:hypothetical protein
LIMRSTPGGIRTPNLLIRSQVLYPVELRALVSPKRCDITPIRMVVNVRTKDYLAVR